MDDVPLPDEPHVFAFAGLPGSGKSTAAEMAVEECEKGHEERATHSEVSDFVRAKFMAEFDKPVTDNELGRWAAEQKDEHGDGYFVREMANALDADDRPHIAISGLRSPDEAEAVRDVFGDEFTTVIAIWTLPDIRFKRKYGTVPSVEHPEWDTFQERNQREIHDWRCVEYFMHGGVSDYVVPNNGSLLGLESNISTLVRRQIFNDQYAVHEQWSEPPFPKGLHEDAIAQYL